KGVAIRRPAPCHLGLRFLQQAGPPVRGRRWDEGSGASAHEEDGHHGSLAPCAPAGSRLKTWWRASSPVSTTIARMPLVSSAAAVRVICSSDASLAQARLGVSSLAMVAVSSLFGSFDDQ